MLKIHKLHSKLLLIPITSILSIGALLGLAYHPNLAHAETVTYKKTIDDVTYMQEMTPEICQSMELEKQYQLIDKRDDRVYWIARLKDDNCWMTQNLDLDIPTEGLKAADTDITKDWNSKSSYPPKATQIWASPSFGTTINNTVSWDPAQGGAERYCRNSYCNDISTTSSNDGHDAQGNYYAWSTAIAGYTDGVGGSICPKGWKLPNGGTNTGEFYNAFNGLALTQLMSKPYYFIFGGEVDGSYLINTGESGYYWAYIPVGSGLAYALTVGIRSINPSSQVTQAMGLSVRCLARTESIPNNNVEITVNNTITLEVDSDIEVEKSDTNPSTVTLPVSVASNQPYTVSISSTNPNFTSTTSAIISPASGTLTSGNNTWGIKKLNNDKTATSQYSAITTSNQIFYTSTAPESTILSFPIGISIAPNLPNGEYSTNITITATQN